MAHLNTVGFPNSIAPGVVYGPEFATEIVATASGKEKRNRVRRNALCVGECSQAPRIRDQYPELLRFFRSVGGRFNTWRFKDWTDFEVSATEGLLGALDDSNTIFQLGKLYEVAEGFEEIRTIQAPIASGFVLMDAGVPLTLTTDYTLDTATGIVTTTTARLSLTWSGQFDNVCRFDTDRMAVRAEAAHVFTWGGIPIKEVRL